MKAIHKDTRNCCTLANENSQVVAAACDSEEQRDEVRVSSQGQTRANGNISKVGRTTTEHPVQGLDTQL